VSVTSCSCAHETPAIAFDRFRRFRHLILRPAWRTVANGQRAADSTRQFATPSQSHKRAAQPPNFAPFRGPAASPWCLVCHSPALTSPNFAAFTAQSSQKSMSKNRNTVLIPQADTHPGPPVLSVPQVSNLPTVSKKGAVQQFAFVTFRRIRHPAPQAALSCRELRSCGSCARRQTLRLPLNRARQQADAHPGAPHPWIE
jgi:hypothetical protein